jgi:hypothetical protein
MKLVTTDATPVYDMGNYPVCYADGINPIDQAGPNSHLVFYMAQKIGDEGARRIIVARVIIPTAALARMARQLAYPNDAIDGTAANAKTCEDGDPVPLPH